MRRFLAVLVLMTGVAAAAAGSLWYYRNNYGEKPLSAGAVAVEREEDPIPPAALPDETDAEDMLEPLLRCVVGVSTATVTKTVPYYYDTREIWNMGSGVIVSQNGYILTNQHVVGERPDRIEVTLYSGDTLQGVAVWSDASLDLAVIKIAGSYERARLGSVHDERIGERVFAVGNPLSMQFERTVTSGIISAMNRTISVSADGVSNYMEDLIQTDAAINAGNSGGPLINENGEVIGINTVKVSEAEGLGFAIPIDIAKPVIDAIENGGSFDTPYLGLHAYTSSAAKYLSAGKTFEKGLYVAQLDNAGPAKKAGLQIGDIIIAMDGTDVDSMLKLREILFAKKSGEEIRLTVSRAKETLYIDVTPQTR